ncbi:MAG: hypothetical protein ACYDBT_17255 [Desulfobulbaceae bacterium]
MPIEPGLELRGDAVGDAELGVLRSGADQQANAQGHSDDMAGVEGPATSACRFMVASVSRVVIRKMSTSPRTTMAVPAQSDPGRRH